MMRDADACFTRGDYDGSARLYRNVLRMAQSKPPADAALFQLGVVYIDPQNPDKDEEEATRSFAAVVSAYPDSGWARQAKIWLAMLEEKARSKAEEESSKQEAEEARQEVERFKQLVESSRQEVEKSRQEVEKSRLDVEKSRQTMEKANQVDLEIEQKKRERGR
jgi:hypothetical protein